MERKIPDGVEFTRWPNVDPRGRCSLTIPVFQRWITICPEDLPFYVSHGEREYYWAKLPTSTPEFADDRWDRIWVSNVKVDPRSPLNTPWWANGVVRVTIREG